MVYLGTRKFYHVEKLLFVWGEKHYFVAVGLCNWIICDCNSFHLVWRGGWTILDRSCLLGVGASIALGFVFKNFHKLYCLRNILNGFLGNIANNKNHICDHKVKASSRGECVLLAVWQTLLLLIIGVFQSQYTLSPYSLRLE